MIVTSGEELTEEISRVIEDSPIERVEIRSVLTCESKKGVCAKCYGRNLATGRMVQNGEAVGVIAAQSIGEPGTQLTLRTFHVGGTAGNIATESNVISKYNGIAEFEELRTVHHEENNGDIVKIVVGRLAELKIVDPNTKISLSTHSIPYGAKLFIKDGAKVKKDAKICEWDPYNAVIASEISGKIEFVQLIEGITFKQESDEQTGLLEIVIIETKDKTKHPEINILSEESEILKTYNLPTNAHIIVKEGDMVKQGDVFAKIPRNLGKAGDITGGLPRVTELFEARNPSNPAVV